MTTSTADIERLLLGYILLKPASFELVAEKLLPQMFTGDQNEIIYEAVLTLHLQKRSITRASVAFVVGDELSGTNTNALFSAMIHEAEKPETVPIGEYAEMILERWKRAEGVELFKQAPNKFTGEARADDVLEDVIAKAHEILRHDSVSTMLAPDKAGARYFEEMADTKRNGHIAGVPIPLLEIKTVLSEDCLASGNLYGLLSSSGEGKTSLTMQLLYHAANEGHPVCFFSYDQSPKQCIRQMVAQNFGISSPRQLRADLSDREFETCKAFADWYDSVPLKIVNCQRHGVDDLVKLSGQFQKKYGNEKTTLFCVDHIGKVFVDPRARMDAGKAAGSINVELKAFCRGENATFLVLNQRNTFGMRRDNPRPISSDLYGGEGAKQDYDAILYLYRMEKYKEERVAIASGDADWKKINRVFPEDCKGKAEIGLLKARFGDPSRKAPLIFDETFTRYKTTYAESNQDELFAA